MSPQIVNTRYAGIRRAAHVNSPTEEYAARGHGRDRGRWRSRVKGRAKVVSSLNEMPIDNILVNENPLKNNEGIEYEFEIRMSKRLKKRKEWKVRL